VDEVRLLRQSVRRAGMGWLQLAILCWFLESDIYRRKNVRWIGGSSVWFSCGEKLMFKYSV